MIKVIKTLKTENDMPYKDILSFKTENYIGMWDYIREEWIVMKASDTELYCIKISDGSSFEELDDAVYQGCEEHIEFVSDRCDYKIILNK